MDGNNRFGKNTLLGGALLLASIALAAAGIMISLRTGETKYFTILSIPTAILVVTGGTMVSKGLLTGESLLQLPGGERTVTAEVLGVTRNLRTAGEKTAYYIVCRYRDPVTLDEYPGKEVIGRQVTVRLDAREKGKYTVEIDPLLEAIRLEKETGGDSSEQADGMH